jgi:hypothetical protein
LKKKPPSHIESWGARLKSTPPKLLTTTLRYNLRGENGHRRAVVESTTSV